MTSLRIIVVGASEGGVTALRALFAALSEGLPAAVFVVLHIGAHDSELPAILNRTGPLPAGEPKDGEAILAGRVYVAPPDRHMIIAEGVIRLTKGPRENFARPSIDPLFRSAAEEFGPAVIGVILTGGLNDGTAGLYEIKRRGGVTIVQDPDDAANPSMPLSALRHVAIDHCTPLAMIPRLIEREVAKLGHLADLSPPTPSEGLESDMSAEFTLDQPVAITCPDCGGALRQSQLGTLKQFRCHIGHAYTAEVMLDGQFRAMEQSIEAAMRSLNERAELCRQMAEQAGPAHASVAQWRMAMDEAHEQTVSLRRLLERDWMHPPTPAMPVA
jgi:two-component system chemotaxis response regulator CheB